MIVKAPGYDPSIHKASLASDVFSTDVICVSSLEQALGVAVALVRDKVQLIELCGGFTPAEADQLRDGIGGTIPVGLVQYSPEELKHLSLLFG